MKSFVIHFFLIATILSCGNRKLPTKKDIPVAVVDTAKTYHDTVEKFVVDDFPVTTEMLEEHRKKQGEIIKHGTIKTGEEVWFSNPSSKQTLIYALATDEFKMTSFCFLNAEIPDDLINQIDLITDEGELAPLVVKKKYLRNFIANADKLDEKYFTSNKGFRLGDSRAKVLQILGKPDSTSSSNNIEKCEWDFTGDTDMDTKSAISKKPIAEDSFGHQINMYFKKGKLIAIIYHNDIP